MHQGLRGQEAPGSGWRVRMRRFQLVGLGVSAVLMALSGCSEAGAQASPELAQTPRTTALTQLRSLLGTLANDAANTTITDICRLDGDGALGGADVPRDYRCSLQGVVVGTPVPTAETESQLTVLNTALTEAGCESSTPLSTLVPTARYACSGPLTASLDASTGLTSSPELAQTLEDAQAEIGGTIVSRGPLITLEEADHETATFVINLTMDYFTTSVCEGLTLCS